MAVTQHDPKDMLDAVQRQALREQQARTLPSVVRHLGQIGMIGWQIIGPCLIGLAAGRWMDRHWHAGVFWTAALMVAGLALGCWSAWRWVQKQ